MNKGKDAKPHVGIFGRRNNGKSSIINALAGQEVAIVSAMAGTTTDPVKKSIEIPGIGASVLVDTAGIDDTGELGVKRIARTRAIIKTIDLAVLVITNNMFGEYEKSLVDEFKSFDLPFFIIHNKSDVEPLSGIAREKITATEPCIIIDFSVVQPDAMAEVIQAIQRLVPESAYTTKSMLGDLLAPDDIVLLVTPIDSEAPEGRMILPQMQAVRDILDNHAVAILLRENQLRHYLKHAKPQPTLVITDSQAFGMVSKIIPRNIPLTSFSIMLAHHKGDFDNYLIGTPKIADLKDGDRVLILESCTHHVSCDDIGRVKIPNWMRKETGKRLEFDTVAGLDNLPRDIHEYALVVQCGGCMITRKQIAGRLRPAVEAGIPVTNYGMAIAWLHGIYERSVAPFLSLEKN
ncbi:MAG: [FeFe] hydrogenase H-cluster maturation GTPase HydF [Clostridia bacterium]|nr:[FeFe] hydrogenase H-cluster maturation GTPase HydF [Clostridia bacterium]